MNIEEFNEQLANDEELERELPIIGALLKDQNSQESIYSICRKVYELQLTADVFRTENGLGYQIDDIHFRNFVPYLKEFISLFSGDEEEIYKESLKVMEKYYRNVATNEEVKARTTLDQSNNKGFGYKGTLYFLDSIDWDYFDNMIKKYL
jgi:hypothetical protein